MVKDDLPKRKCNVENVILIIQILWFETECPIKYANYQDPKNLREVFI